MSQTSSKSLSEPALVRIFLILVGLLYFFLILLLPLFAVFGEALRKGFLAYWSALANPESLAAIKLTLLTAAIAVPFNVVFGVAAAWTITKFNFRGKKNPDDVGRPPFCRFACRRRFDLRTSFRLPRLVRTVVDGSQH